MAPQAPRGPESGGQVPPVKTIEEMTSQERLGYLGLEPQDVNLSNAGAEDRFTDLANRLSAALAEVEVARAAQAEAEAGEARAIGAYGEAKRGRKIATAVAAIATAAAVGLGIWAGYERGQNDSASAATGDAAAQSGSAKPDTDKPSPSGAEADTQKGPAAKLGLSEAEYKRLAPVANNANVDTAEEAAAAYRGANFDQVASDILGNPEAFKNVDISHFMNRMNAIDGDTNIRTMKALEVQYIGITQSEGLALAAANLVQGQDMRADRSDSHAEQIEIVRKFVLNPNTKVDGDYRLNDTRLNGRIIDGSEKVEASPLSYQDERAIRVYNDETGQELIWKLDADGPVPGLCNNFQQEIPESPRITTTSTPPGAGGETPPPADEETPPGETPPEEEEKGKDARRSPLGGRDAPDEDRRAEIPAPAVAIQRDDAPAVDPYVPPTPEARDDIIAGGSDPRGGAATTGTTVATPTPVTEGGNVPGNQAGVDAGQAPESEAEPANSGTVTGP